MIPFFAFFIVALVSDLKCAQQVRRAVAPTLKASVAGCKSLYCSTAILSITKSCNCNKCQEMSSQTLRCRSVSHRLVLRTELWHDVQPMVGPVILINTRLHRLSGSLISRLGCSQQSLSRIVAKWRCTSSAAYITAALRNAWNPGSMFKRSGVSRKAARRQKIMWICAGGRTINEEMNNNTGSDWLAQPKRPMRRVKLLTVWWVIMGGYKTVILRKKKRKKFGLEQYEHLQSSCYTQAR